MPGCPATVKARKALRIARTHELLRKGWSLPQIAQDLGVCVRQVKTYRSLAFQTLSQYPGSFSAEEVQQFRGEEAELISETEASVISTLGTIKERIGSKEERNLDASSAARLADSVARLSERKARLLGLDVPQKSVQEVFSLQIKKVDSRVTVHFDPAQLKPAWTDVGFRRVPGDDQTPALPLSHSPVAVLANGDGAAELVGAPINDSGAFSQNGGAAE